MKKTLITLAVAILALPALALPKATALTDAGFLPEKARGYLRGIVQTAVRHLLNFREESPLTSDQRTQVGAVLEKHRPQVRALVQRGKDARRAFEKSARKSGPNSAATREAAELIAGVARDRALLMARVGSEVRPLLSADQQQRLEAARDELHDLVDAALAEKNL